MTDEQLADLAAELILEWYYEDEGLVFSGWVNKNGVSMTDGSTMRGSLIPRRWNPIKYRRQFDKYLAPILGNSRDEGERREAIIKALRERGWREATVEGNGEWLDRPDCHGLWWMKYDGKTMITWVSVGTHSYFLRIGRGEDFTVADYKGAKWQGPIKPPEPPKP